MIKYWTIEDVGADASVADVLIAEARRIRSRPTEADRRLGFILDHYDFVCPGDAADVLRNASDVMAIINDASQAGPWPTDGEWPNRLPAWFVDACKPEDEEEEEERVPWHELSDEERIAQCFSEKWKLTDWTFWMEPAERAWLWWSAEIRDPNTIRAHLDRLGDPSPGPPPGFWWLFSASGAVEYNYE